MTSQILFVLHRRKDSLLIQRIRNPVLTHAIDFHTKDVLYDLSCVCIHNQLIPVIFILQIAIAGERPDKFAFFPFDSQVASDLYG